MYTKNNVKLLFRSYFRRRLMRFCHNTLLNHNHTQILYNECLFFLVIVVEKWFSGNRNLKKSSQLLSALTVKEK